MQKRSLQAICHDIKVYATACKQTLAPQVAPGAVSSNNFQKAELENLNEFVRLVEKEEKSHLKNSEENFIDLQRKVSKALNKSSELRDLFKVNETKGHQLLWEYISTLIENMRANSPAAIAEVATA